MRRFGLERFGSVEDARAWARDLFQWYNHDHHHTRIGLLTPTTVHHGQAPAVLAARQEVLTTAYAAHPERFVQRQPRPANLPLAVWINPPATGAILPPTLMEAETKRTGPLAPLGASDSVPLPTKTTHSQYPANLSHAY